MGFRELAVMAVSRWPLGLSQSRWSVLQSEGRRFRLRAVEGAGVAGTTPEPTRACSLAGGCGQRRWGHSRVWGSWRWVLRQAEDTGLLGAE